MDDKKEHKFKRDSKVSEKCRQIAEQWTSYFSDNIDQYYEMYEFILGDQWDDNQSQVLKNAQKTPLVVNKVYALSNSVLGEFLVNTPQLEVVPISGSVTEEEASLYEAINKDIIFRSGAKTAYQQATTQAVIGGYSAFMPDTDYIGNYSFDVDFIMRWFKDPTKCYWDVSDDSIHKTKGMHCGYYDHMSWAKLEQTYGKDVAKEIRESSSSPQNSKSEVSIVSGTDSSSDVFEWIGEDFVTRQHHFSREYTDTTIYSLSNGKVVDQDELDEIIEQSTQILLEMGGQVVDDMVTLIDEGQPVRIEEQREIQKSTITYQLFVGDFIVEETEFPSDDLPIVFVAPFFRYLKSGKMDIVPFFRFAKDPQKYLNYLATQSAYTLKVSRYDQWIGVKENVSSAKTAAIWKNPLLVQGMLTYDKASDGSVPQQIKPPELSSAMITQYQRAMEDIYTCTGLYPTRLGDQGVESSGKAVNARERQGSHATYTLYNAIFSAITEGGNICSQMIPRVYDSERVLNIMMPDEGRRQVTINRQADEYGEQIENDIRKGKYQVQLRAGPSYEGQKEQALESLQMVLQANPQLMDLVADLYAENLPLANNIELKNRLKTIVPPDVIQAGKTGQPVPQNKGPSPEEQMMQLKMKDLQLKEQELQLKAQEMQVKSQQEQQKIQIDMERIQNERTEIAAKLEEQELRYMAETGRTRSDEAISHADNITKILTSKIN